MTSADVPTHYAILKQLKDFDFAPRERLIVELILEKSFGVGRTRAYFPRLHFFVAMTRITPGNVSSILRRLIRCRVIEECSAGVYAVRLPVEQWAVSPRIQTTVAVRELDQWLDLDPAQMDLVPEPPSLNQALREINFPTLCREGAGDGSLRADRRYVDPPSTVQRPVMGSGPVPESGIPELGTDVPESGTVAEAPCKQASCVGLPELGTPFKALRVHSLKPSEEALNSELSALREGESEGKPAGSRIGNEAEWLGQVAELVGPKTMKQYGGWYRKRLRENLGKFERVLSAVALDKREGMVARNWGGHFFDLWNRFAD